MEIAESYGYKKYAKSNLNNTLIGQSKHFGLDEDLKKKIYKSGYESSDSRMQEFKELNEYSVSITFSNLFIPSVPCEKVSIKRTYDIFRENETIQILIDGKEK
jgi:DNA sulfur modification protein DndD